MTTAANFRYPRVQGEDEGRGVLEVEAEDEYELEDEFEGEEFGALGRALGGFLAGGAERDAEDEFEVEFEVEFEFEAEAEVESEYEAEAEDELEDESFVNPIRRIYRDAELMAHLSTRAAQAADEAEAEAFVGAMVPMVARLVPRAGKLLVRNAPTLIKGVSRLGRQLRRSPAARAYVTTIPVILQRTAQSLADQAAAGRPVAPDTVLRTLGTIASRVLQPGNRRRAARAVGVFDRRYHNRWGQGRRAASVSGSKRRSSTPAASRARRRR